MFRPQVQVQQGKNPVQQQDPNSQTVVWDPDRKIILYINPHLSPNPQVPKMIDIPQKDDLDMLILNIVRAIEKEDWKTIGIRIEYDPSQLLTKVMSFYPLTTTIF